MVNPSYLWGVVMLAGVFRRRQPRARETAFQFALMAVLLLGVLVVITAVFAVVGHRFDIALVGPSVALGLAVVVAVSLSRPSAKAWFASGPRAG